MQSLQDARERAWFAWRNHWRKTHLDSPDGAEPDPASIWEAAWNQGGADALRRSAQMADLSARLEDLTRLYREVC